MATVPFKVKAIYQYTSSHEDDLPFSVGQIITVTDEEDPEWYGGEYVDDSGTRQEGIFPRNFVERFEPTAPPRPARTRKKEPEPPVAVAPPEPEPEPQPQPQSEREHEPQSEQPVEEDNAETPSEGVQEKTPVATPQALPVKETHPAEVPTIPVANPPVISSVPAPAPIESKDVDTAGTVGILPLDPPPQTKAPAAQPRAIPPPVSEKPMSNSFKDRIAAFNKAAAPPVAPFKPSGLGSGSSSFIKKPFVAPPPSRNAFVPPPRDVPVTKIHRRDEDPQIKDARAEPVESVEQGGPISSASPEPQNEDQPKPTTLKERIALLQRQQAEAAQRHADVVAKKEKPKRPPKKRMDSDAPQEASVSDQPAEPEPPVDRKDSIEVANENPVDESRSAKQSLSIHRRSTGPVENDGNEADMSGAGDTTEGQEDLTERDDSDEKHKPSARIAAGTVPEGQATEEEETREEEEEEEEEVDPEIRRKEELRARMAKMSGGMGMAGMFGPPGMMALGGAPPAKKPKPPAPVERRPSEISEGPSSPRMTAPPIPTLMALPGMGKQKQPVQEDPEPELKEDSVEEEVVSSPTTEKADLEPESTSQATRILPPVPGGRPAPPSVPTESRLPPPPPPNAIVSPSHGSESDDEMSEHPSKLVETSKAETSPSNRVPPPVPMMSPPLPTSPRSSRDKRNSYMGEDMLPASPGLSPQQSKRNSRPPPPIPGASPHASTQARPPPPPPPNAVLSRTSTADEQVVAPMKPGRLDNGEEGEVTEYEGDYDTDMASSVHHRDALKHHARESSFEDSFSARSPGAELPPKVPPPFPGNAVPRAGPPPIPTQPPPSSRASLDILRGAPPPIPSQPAPRPRASVDIPRAPPPPPPPKPTSPTYDDDYDPYNYNGSPTTPGLSHSTPLHEKSEEYAPYQAPPPPPPSQPTDRRAPPSAPSSSRAPQRKSLDVLRPHVPRRSMDTGRPSMSMETGYMANEIDLASHTQWWLSRKAVPPVFQGRKDIYTESEESKSTENGIKWVIKEVFILYQDYSQTVITIRFDPKDASQTELGQRHEPPPRSLRQDELEDAYEKFGRRIAQSVASKKDSVVGDGTPHALVYELLRPLKQALLPVGTRAYGALVYANMANAATQLNDEIRPGDIISIRNAKFQGKHGPMHAKYSMEVGKPDHVAVVAEWDGTKKKVRAYEQGRESKKVKLESFKLEDLRSGEVKIWRVMPRTWVGWSLQD